MLHGKSGLQNSFLEAPMLLVEDAEDLFKSPVLLFLAGGRPAFFLVLCSLKAPGKLCPSPSFLQAAPPEAEPGPEELLPEKALP